MTTALLIACGVTRTAAEATGRARTNVSRETTVTAPGALRFTFVTLVTFTLMFVTVTCGRFIDATYAGDTA